MEDAKKGKKKFEKFGGDNLVKVVWWRSFGGRTFLVRQVWWRTKFGEARLVSEKIWWRSFGEVTLVRAVWSVGHLAYFLPQVSWGLGCSTIFVTR